MTTLQIELLFNATLEEKAIYNELTGISEDKIYNWRKGRGPKPTIGDMLNVLYQLEKIEVRIPFSDAFDSAAKKHQSKSPSVLLTMANTKEYIEDRNGKRFEVPNSERPNPNKP